MIRLVSLLRTVCARASTKRCPNGMANAQESHRYGSCSSTSAISGFGRQYCCDQLIRRAGLLQLDQFVWRGIKHRVGPIYFQDNHIVTQTCREHVQNILVSHRFVAPFRRRRRLLIVRGAYGTQFWRHCLATKCPRLSPSSPPACPMTLHPTLGRWSAYRHARASLQQSIATVAVEVRPRPCCRQARPLPHWVRTPQCDDQLPPEPHSRIRASRQRGCHVI